MQNLIDLIKQHNWILIYKNWDPEQIVDELLYEDSMRLAYQMLINKHAEENLMNFAVDLLQIIRKKYSQNWESDWRNDLFLGDACHITIRFPERYQAYKQASLKFNTLNLPPSLLVSLAGCYLAPDRSPISIEEAERLTKVALEKEQSIEAVTLIRGICKTQGRENEFFYWSNILKELEKKKAYMKNEWPEWLMNNY